MKKTEYRKYLNSKKWRNRRKVFFKILKKRVKGNLKCFCCKEESICWNVHHINYSRIGKEKSKDLILVCHDCHKKIHDKIKNNGWHLWEAHFLLRKEIKKLKKEKCTIEPIDELSKIYFSIEF